MSNAQISSIESAIGFDARIVPEGMTQLYTRDGQMLWVPSDAVPRFLADGYLAHRIDPLEACREFLATVKACVGPTSILEQDLTGDSQAYPKNLETVAAAVQLMMNAWAKLTAVAWVNPEPEPGVKLQRLETVTTPNAEGESLAEMKVIEVDPGQVALYEAQGYERVTEA